MICPNCLNYTHPNYLRCPHCGTRQGSSVEHDESESTDAMKFIMVPPGRQRREAERNDE